MSIGYNLDHTGQDPAQRWFSVPVRVPRPRLRLICFPHSGAGASVYYPWAASFAEDGIELWNVQYPGRQNRLAEPAITKLSEMNRRLLAAFRAIESDVPVAMFGHSMGAALAHSLACELNRQKLATPLHLFLSGRNAPHHFREPDRIHLLSDCDLVDKIARLGHFPDSIREKQELVDLLVPVLRSDFTLLHDYWESFCMKSEKPVVEIPISVFGGDEDPWTTHQGLSDWQQYTSLAFKLRTYPGDHFYLNEMRSTLQKSICDDAGLVSGGTIPEDRLSRTPARESFESTVL